jgi:hypothetical protein
MSYTETNFKTKKDLKSALAEGKSIGVYQPGMGTIPENGIVFLEGPHYPAAHTWYAQGKMVAGKLVSVK